MVARVEVMVMAGMVAGVAAGKVEAKLEVDRAMVVGLMVEECCS